MRMILLLCLSNLPLVAFGFGPLEVQPDVLVIKTKNPMGTWGALALLDSFRVAEVAEKIRTISPSFSSLRSWSTDSEFPSDQYFTVRLKKGASLETAIAEIKQFESVESVQPDYLLSDPEIVVPVDPQITRQWYLQTLKVTDAWEITRGAGVLVADVESGFDTEHPDLVHQFDRDRSFDYDPETDDPHKVNDNKRSHGTPVCGIIAAEAFNNLFGVGIAYEAKLIGSQMANTMQSASVESVWTVNSAKAILGSIEKGASVVLIEKQVPSLLSSVERVQVIYDAIKTTVDAGVPVVVPAGNFSSELKVEAEQPDTGSIMVGAIMHDGTAADFSNYGDRLSVSAPGEDVYSTQENGGETLGFGGTSSASAITAGITALVRSANSRLSPREIRQILMETAVAVPGTKKVGPLILAGPAVRRASGR